METKNNQSLNPEIQPSGLGFQNKTNEQNAFNEERIVSAEDKSTDLVRSMAERYDIPLKDMEYKSPIEHKSVLNALLNELTPIDFRERAKLDSSDTLSRKHYVIIANEAILEVAHKNKWSLCKTNESVYTFNGCYWKEQDKSTMINFLGSGSLKLGVDEFEAKHYKFREELYKQFLMTAFLPKPENNTDGVMINLKNGTYVITPERHYLKDFDRGDFLTHQLDFSYDPEAEAPMFRAFLDRVLPEKELQMILAEFVGYVFVKQKTLKLEKALILYGSGANGKSTLFHVVITLLGAHNVSNYSLNSLTMENGYYRAGLINKLLNFASEISPKMDSTLFKQMVSGEPIEARLPYKEPFIMSDYAKLMFNTNILPRDIENNEAFFRRFVLIPFRVTIPEEERDSTLAQKIVSKELAGVFNWVLEGLQRLLTNKRLTHSDIVDRTLMEYRQQSDTVFMFLDEENYISCNVKVKSLSDLYNEYTEYCRACNYKACSRKTFAERLRGLNYSVIRKNHGNVVGIRKKDF